METQTQVNLDWSPVKKPGEQFGILFGFQFFKSEKKIRGPKIFLGDLTIFLVSKKYIIFLSHSVKSRFERKDKFYYKNGHVTYEPENCLERFLR